MKKNSKERIINLLDTACVNNGYELIDVQFLNLSSGFKLVVYIDKPNGIGIDDCVEFNNTIDKTDGFDELIGSPYSLEVSSPGPKRPLKSMSDFIRYQGKRVTIKLSEPHESKKNVFIGEIESVRKKQIGINDSGKLYTIEYRTIEKANLNL